MSTLPATSAMDVACDPMHRKPNHRSCAASAKDCIQWNRHVRIVTSSPSAFRMELAHAEVVSRFTPFSRVCGAVTIFGDSADAVFGCSAQDMAKLCLRFPEIGKMDIVEATKFSAKFNARPQVGRQAVRRSVLHTIVSDMLCGARLLLHFPRRQLGVTTARTVGLSRVRPMALLPIGTRKRRLSSESCGTGQTTRDGEEELTSSHMQVVTDGAM